jgi:hypothetical protein
LNLAGLQSEKRVLSPFRERLEMHRLFALVLAAATIGGGVAGFAWSVLLWQPSVVNPMTTLKDFQPLVATSVALLGVVIGAAASFAKTISDDEARREASRSIEIALKHRSRRAVEEMVKTAQSILDLGARSALDLPHESMRDQAVRARNTLEQLYTDLSKVDSRRVPSIVEAIETASFIVDRTFLILYMASDIKAFAGQGESDQWMLNNVLDSIKSCCEGIVSRFKSITEKTSLLRHHHATAFMSSSVGLDRN